MHRFTTFAYFLSQFRSRATRTSGVRPHDRPRTLSWAARSCMTANNRCSACRWPSPGSRYLLPSRNSGDFWGLYWSGGNGPETKRCMWRPGLCLGTVPIAKSRNGFVMFGKTLMTVLVVLLCGAAQPLTGSAFALTAEVAKKCQALTTQAYPPRVPGNPAAGSSRGTGREQQEYFKKCVANKGNMQ